MKFLLLLLFITLPSLASTVLSEFIKVNPYTLPGDTEQNHLPLPGIRWHESNDFFGKTDKLMTQTSSLNVMGIWKDRFSTSLSYKGRFVQPILKTRYGEEELPSPIGIYAEWAEVMLNQSVTFMNKDSWPALKLDGGLGYNDFGDHPFADYHRNIHSFVGSENEENRYGKKQDVNFITTSAAASIILPFNDQLNLMGSYQIMNSRVFREDAQEASLVWRKSESFAASVKYSFVKQKRSEFYDLRNHRTQFIWAVRLFKFWTPSIMHVSTYVRGDKYGQWYLSPISLTYPF
ncbi:MAG TPA: hypothetical protein VNJ08_10820 [Bacteriovoracaceae bacterium]|nr:hypothetical protein [Bacteriovoracaceae bacterium]